MSDLPRDGDAKQELTSESTQVLTALGTIAAPTLDPAS
jgi:hypothetical protein